MTDLKVLLTHDCGHLWVSVQRSKICHVIAVNGVSARRDLEKKNVVDLFYGSLAYGDLGKKLQATKKFGEQFTEVVAESFRR